MLEILLAGLIVAAIGLPFVNAYEKGKKEMQEADENERT